MQEFLVSCLYVTKMQGWRKGSAHSLTSVLAGGMHHPLSTNDIKVPTGEENGRAPGQIWAGAENLAPTGFDSRIV
jgi:hypothetical protein